MSHLESHDFYLMVYCLTLNGCTSGCGGGEVGLGGMCAAARKVCTGGRVGGGKAYEGGWGGHTRDSKGLYPY